MGGVCKPLLEVDGVRIIDRQLAAARLVFARVVLVASAAPPPELLALGLPMLADRIGPGAGPIAGLDAGLAWLPEGFEALVCVAGDLPFLSEALLRRLCEHPAGRSLVPRRAGGQVEPLCARYARAAAEPLRAFLAGGGRTLRAFVDRLAPDYLEEPELDRLAPGGMAFTNLNEPDDLRALDGRGPRKVIS